MQGETSEDAKMRRGALPAPPAPPATSSGMAAHRGGPGASVNCGPANAAWACWLGRASHAKPLRRSRLASAVTRPAAERRVEPLRWKGLVARKTKEEMPYLRHLVYGSA